MTGASNNGTSFYIFGNNYTSDPVIQKYTSAGSTSSLYMDNFPGLGSTSYDTAWLDGGIWIARDNPDSPIIAYDTDGLLVGHVDGTTLSAAMGLTIDGDGYLWASNPDDKKIYQIDVGTGIGEDPETSGARIVEVIGNPFESCAVITGEGFTGATIEIYDTTGRRILQDGFTGNYVWNAEDIPSGSYFVIVRDEMGITTSRLTKIR